MSQPSVTAYFSTRKRQAVEELRGKAKVLLLERDHSSGQALIDTENSDLILDGKESTSPRVVLKDALANTKEAFRVNKAVRNIHFDSPKASPDKAARPRTRAARSRRLPSADGGQTDIRDSLLRKRSDDAQTITVPFEKKGALSPKKKQPQTPRKSSFAPREDTIKEDEQLANSPTSSKMISTMEKQMKIEHLNMTEIRNRLNKSSRLKELQDRIQKIKQCEQALENMNKQCAEGTSNKEVAKPKMRKFEKIEVEVPVSPQKGYKSPTKALLTPTKSKDLTKTASPQRRLLFEPKEASPVKFSPTKAHERYRSLVESVKPGLTLPSSYRFLAEVFRSIETVSAILFNRQELITFTKLKPKVQELLRRDLTLNHLAQIKTIYPDAYNFHQEKYRNFGSVSKQEKYELVLTPTVEAGNGRNTPDADDILKCGSESSMGPKILLERRKKFYNALLERVRDEHEKFLQSCGHVELLNIPREKLVCWHPMFDVETCKDIEEAELPQPPQVEKPTAKDVLDKAKSLFNCGTRMEKALERLAEAKSTSSSKSPSPTQDSTTQTTKDGVPKVDIAIVDTPPTTPSTKDYVNSLLKGIPKALLEKVRARQAAKALEAMTRTPNADKEAALYARLPELAKLLRNIFVTEKKGVLSMEAVIQKLDNSFRTKLTSQELEEHVRLLCRLLPTWCAVHNVRKIDYLKLNRNVALAKVIKQLEVLAEDKVKIKVS